MSMFVKKLVNVARGLGKVYQQEYESDITVNTNRWKMDGYLIFFKKKTWCKWINKDNGCWTNH